MRPLTRSMAGLGSTAVFHILDAGSLVPNPIQQLADSIATIGARGAIGVLARLLLLEDQKMLITFIDGKLIGQRHGGSRGILLKETVDLLEIVLYAVECVASS